MGESKEEKAKAKAKAKEMKDEAEPSPPPIVLFVDLHCVGCANKIERSILKCRGVEEVEVDMEQNMVTVKGIVDPQALCSRIQQKTMRKARLLSPAADADASQIGGLATIELHVNMHCEACAQQLRRKLLKMRGVQSADTELSTGKVAVTGTMNAGTLAEYIYRHTGKLVNAIPPSPNEEDNKEDAEKKPEEKKDEKIEEKNPEEKTNEKIEEKKPEEKKDEKIEEKKDKEEVTKAEEKVPREQDTPRGSKEGGSKEENGGGEKQNKEEKKLAYSIISEEDVAKKMVYWYGGVIGDEEMVRKMSPWMPVYMMQQPLPPPPQLFSDENPNACCIS